MPTQDVKLEVNDKVANETLIKLRELFKYRIAPTPVGCARIFLIFD